MRVKTLGELCNIASGGTPSRSQSSYWNDGTIPWIKIGNIKGKYVDNADEYITQEGLDNSSAKMFSKGTILYTIFATLGEVGILTIDACTNQAIAGITIKDHSEVLLDFLFYYLKSKKAYVNKIGRGVAQNNINMSILRGFKVPLPSISEQHQIVSVLDAVSNVIGFRQKQLTELDNLIKARFVEMFGHPVSNEMNWSQVPLAACIDSIDNGKSFVCDTTARQGNWPAVLKLSAATYGFYRPEENKAMLDDRLFLEDAAVRAGDLLFTRKNTPELVGMCAYVYNTPQKLMMPDLIFRLNTTTDCNKIFLWKLINHDFFRERIQSIATGSAKSMSNISKERLLGLTIILPPIKLQEQFAAFVEQVDKSKVVVQKALDEAQTLFDSLMQEYFG